MFSIELKEFIDANIRSVEALETLLLIRSDPKHAWDAIELARKIETDPISASNHLMSLYLNGLIRHESEKGRLSPYSYGPHPHAQEKRVAELEDTFRSSREEVIEYITYRHQPAALGKKSG